ncbi:hypothetical protein CDAR_488561 [Caerostris darwini]|uniref:Uncharacterized protein n=1 Tax=Caerostris darwini TaxID=1538125 RepID=A0AAV4WMF5_9ARAC|nr:hypothetical protein CDAR_488561 [Caerostris darwini]
MCDTPNAFLNLYVFRNASFGHLPACRRNLSANFRECFRRATLAPSRRPRTAVFQTLDSPSCRARLRQEPCAGSVLRCRLLRFCAARKKPPASISSSA